MFEFSRQKIYNFFIGPTHRYELEVDKTTILNIEENEFNHLGFIVVHSNPTWHGKAINAQQVVKTESKSKKKRKQKPTPLLPPNHKCPIKVTSQDAVEAVYVDFQDTIFQTCHGGVVKAKSHETILVTPLMLTSKEIDESGNRKCTVFENHRKSLIQHCERSELRLHFEWTKVN